MRIRIMATRASAVLMSAGLMSSCAASSANAPPTAPPNPQEGVAAHWALDAVVDGIVEDEHGNVPGRASGTTATASGARGAALTFSGDDHVEFGDSLDDVFAGEDKAFSIALWIRPIEQRPYQTLVMKQADSACSPGENARQWGLRLNGGRVEFWYYMELDSPHNALTVISADPVPLSQWTHVAVTYDGARDESPDGRVTVFINGVQTPTRTTGRPRGFPRPIPDGSAYLTLGSNTSSSGKPCAPYNFHGDLDDLVIWRRALSGREVAMVFDQPTSLPSRLPERAAPATQPVASIMIGERSGDAEPRAAAGPLASCQGSQPAVGPRPLTIRTTAPAGICKIKTCGGLPGDESGCVESAVAIRRQGAPETGTKAAYTFTYDGEGRLVEYVGPQRTERFQYDAGRLVQADATQWGKTTQRQFIYDERGRLLRVEQRGAAPTVAVTSIGYGDGCRPESITAANGAITSYEFDGRGRLARLSRSVAGRRTVTQLVHVDPGAKEPHDPLGLIFRYDESGRLASSLQANENYSFKYDDQDSLVSATYLGGPESYEWTMSGYCPFVLCHTPDPVGDPKPQACIEPLEGWIRVLGWPAP